MFLGKTAFAGGARWLDRWCDSRVAKFSGHTSHGTMTVTAIFALFGHSIGAGRGTVVPQHVSPRVLALTASERVRNCCRGTAESGGGCYCALSPCVRGQLGCSAQRMGEGEPPHPTVFVALLFMPSPAGEEGAITNTLRRRDPAQPLDDVRWGLGIDAREEIVQLLATTRRVD